ncbi:DUF7130 family rubredoxin-like protein [Salinigranum sp. GCM10025319]|uniref:DUF7130 family rubredoxin-like protein n=1 Tax=Salinigranum sp. GCM10025319 TaxID=3252687 RepID=UPI00360B06D4
MVLRSPTPTTSARVDDHGEPDSDTGRSASTASAARTRRLVDVGRDEPSPVTASRAVRPPTIVRNKRLADDGFGEAFLVWHCLDCGAVGSLDALPSRCVCGARRENLAYVIED